MEEIGSLDTKARRKPPMKCDDECHLADNLPAITQEPVNIQEEWAGEHFVE